MKLFSTVFHRKRGVILFVAAFLLPLIFVVLAGVDTFSKRQKTTRNLLESNLWLSGRSALEQLEEQFTELERTWLNPPHFTRLQKQDGQEPINTNPYFYLIDTTFRILYPKVLEDNINSLLISDQTWNSAFKVSMEKAKVAEGNKSTCSKALLDYRESLKLAQTKEQEALAIEGLARTNRLLGKYTNASDFYRLLKNKYSQVTNLAGHPYGLTAPLQLYTINNQLNRVNFGNDSLLIVYQMMLDRHWRISAPSFSFFKTEYEDLLGISAEANTSEFEKVLNYYRFLEMHVLPLVMEKVKYAGFTTNNEISRTCLKTEETQYLISFERMNFSESGQTYFAGICWNLDTVLNSIIPGFIKNLEEETSLEFRLIDDNNINLYDGTLASPQEESLTLHFNNIPFPWSLVAIQPGYEKLESDAKTEVIIYGLLIVIIIALMVFAVYAILRQISRETNSMILQTEFVHNVSHELKTPLSLIRLYGETLLLKENLPDKDQKEGLQIITKESERLSHMINNILDFSKIEMGKKEFEIQPGELKEVVENTLDSYRYHLLKKGFEIKEEIDASVPTVLFDKSAVEGILINLLSNAIKFSSHRKQVVVRLSKTGKKIVLEVADKGIGIPEKELPNIFNRFYRVKGNSDFEARGSGLGLTLVKHVLEAHGWQISVKSQPGEGSTFSIIIPVNLNKEEE